MGYVTRSRAFMPPGTISPFVMRFDVGSIPVGYLVLRSETKSIGEIQDQALFKVRPMFASLPGVSAPPPFGGNQPHGRGPRGPGSPPVVPDVPRRGDQCDQRGQLHQPLGQRPDR